MSRWHIFAKITQLFEQEHSWTNSLSLVNEILLETFAANASWLLTLSPLPSISHGMVQTPLTNNPQAHVQLLDYTPLLPEKFIPPDVLKQVMTYKKVGLLEPDTITTDTDLIGDLFNTFHINPTVIIPLHTSTLIVGVLIVATTDDPSADDILYFSQVGEFLGGVLFGINRLDIAEQGVKTLNNKVSELHQDVQQQLDETNTIAQLSLAINTGQGLSETARKIVEKFSQLFTFTHLSVALLDEVEANVRQWVFHEYGCNEQHDLFVPLENSALGELLANFQPRIYSDITNIDDTYVDHQTLCQEGIRAKITIPFRTAKGLCGGINLGHPSADIYTAYDLKLLEKLVPHVAMMIENAQLIDTMELHTNKLKMLNHLGEMLVSVTDSQRIVDITLSMLPRLLPSDVQGVVLVGEDGAYLGAAIPYNFNRTRTTLEEIHNTFVEMVGEDLPTELASSKRIAGNMPVSSDWKPTTILSLPILTRQGTLGILYIASGSEEHLSNEFLRIFSLAASQVSSVVENANLFRQVEQERARLAAILSSSTDAILVVHRDGRVVLDNPPAWQVMGVETSQRGKQLAKRTANRALVELFQQAMAGGTPNGEIPLEDGRTLFANLSPVSFDGHTIGWVATMQDVTYFKELDGLKTDFVNAVSHDLRSPLSSILIAAHMLPKIGPITDMQKDMLGTIEKKVDTMSHLISDLLDVGKIEAGIDMDMKPLSVEPILNEIVSSLMTQANDKSIQLAQTIEGNLPQITANKTRLHQVFNNLIGNAIKYTPEKGTVTVNAFRYNQEIRIQIQDTGLGIPVADQPHIFEKFYRVRGEHVKAIKGTGLGLAITKSIVEKHNGRIWLKSVFGKGSTFTTALPVFDEYDIQN